MLGLAWAPARLPKTVIRAGAGLYYEPLTSPGLDAERATLGPPGLGRADVSRKLASEHSCPVSLASLSASRWISATVQPYLRALTS